MSAPLPIRTFAAADGDQAALDACLALARAAGQPLEVAGDPGLPVLALAADRAPAGADAATPGAGTPAAGGLAPGAEEPGGRALALMLAGADGAVAVALGGESLIGAAGPTTRRRSLTLEEDALDAALEAAALHAARAGLRRVTVAGAGLVDDAALARLALALPDLAVVRGGADLDAVEGALVLDDPVLLPLAELVLGGRGGVVAEMLVTTAGRRFGAVRGGGFPSLVQALVLLLLEAGAADAAGRIQGALLSLSAAERARLGRSPDLLATELANRLNPSQPPLVAVPALPARPTAEQDRELIGAVYGVLHGAGRVEDLVAAMNRIHGYGLELARVTRGGVEVWPRAAGAAAGAVWFCHWHNRQGVLDQLRLVAVMNRMTALALTVVSLEVLAQHAPVVSDVTPAAASAML